MNTMYSESSNKKQHPNMKRFLVKISMFILCLTGFFVHSYFKIRLFYDQEPITEYLSNEANSVDDELIKLPSISICFSGSLFRRPIETVNNHRRSSLYYHSRQRLPPNVALLDDLDTHTQFDDDFTLRRRHSRKFNSNPKQLSRSANQMISVDQAFGLVSKPKFSLKCDLIKPTKQRKLTRFTDNPLSCEQIAQVVESINYEADKKCFTFFSQLQQTQDVEEDDFLVYRSDLNGGDLLQIRIFFEEELLSSKLNQDKVHVLIHSNLEMPNLQMKTYSLHSSHNYVIYFNQLAYKRMSTNQSPCRLYKNEIKKDYFSISNLKHVKNALMDYQVMIKNHLYKLLFSSNESQNSTAKVDEIDKNLDNNSNTELKNDLESRSEADCVDKCHVETNRKYCICLPPGVNVRRELLSANDLLCDSLRCIQEDLPSANVGTSSSANKNNLKKDQQASSSDQLERLYSLSNSQFVSKRQEKFKKCLEKNNCISSCEEERYDFDVNENADLNSIIQNLMGILPNKTRHSKSLINSTIGKRFARNYYPDGYYFDPNYSQKQQQTSTSSVNKFENKRFSFRQNQQPTIGASSKTTPIGQDKSTFDDLSQNFIKNNGTKILNTSIIVQDSKRNQTSFTTSSTNRKQNTDQKLFSQHSNSQTNAYTDSVQLKTTTPAKFETLSPLTTSSSGDEINSIDPDNIDDNLDKEDDLNNQDNKDFTQPSLSKYTIYSRKSFKTFSTSTQASTKKNDNNNSIDDEITDNLPVDENIEERNLHSSGKSYQSLISFRNNRNGNRILKQRLSYSFIDLVFDLSLVAVVWLGFSIYLVVDYVIYLVVLLFWYSVRLLFCLDWWFKRTRKRHRVVDSASSTVQLANRPSRASKGSVSSEESEGRTFVKSIP